MNKEQNILKKIKKKLKFSYEIGKNPNNNF